MYRIFGKFRRNLIFMNSVVAHIMKTNHSWVTEYPTALKSTPGQYLLSTLILCHLYYKPRENSRNIASKNKGIRQYFPNILPTILQLPSLLQGTTSYQDVKNYSFLDVGGRTRGRTRWRTWRPCWPT